MAKRSNTAEQEDLPATLTPLQNEQLVAHEVQEKQMLALINAKRLPHAILMTGPRGIGKATFAHRLARFLLAPSETGGLFGEPLPAESLYIAPTHPTFRRILAGAHPDLLVLEGEDIKIEEARRVGAFLSLTPAESKWRAVVIDSADALNRNAANALLKILEEPPEAAVLLLVSHNPGTLLPTIRSRCRALRFLPLSETDFGCVMAIAAPNISKEESHALAVLSDFSPGIALSLMQVNAMELYKELLDRVSTPDTLKLYGFAERFARKENAGEWQVLSRLLLWLLARISTWRAGIPEVFPGEGERVKQLRETKPLDLWAELWEKARRLLADTEHLHLDRKQVLLTLLRGTAD